MRILVAGAAAIALAAGGAYAAPGKGQGNDALAWCRCAPFAGVCVRGCIWVCVCGSFCGRVWRSAGGCCDTFHDTAP